MRKNIKKRVMLASVSVVIVCLLVVASLQFAGVINLFASDYHTGIHPSTINYMETQRYWQDCWQGQSSPGTGYPFKEMMPDTKYVTSFSGATGNDALSERISIQGNLYEDDWTEVCHPLRAYYNVYIREDPADPTWHQILGLNYYNPAYLTVSGGTGWRTCNYNPVGGDAQEIWLSSMEIRLIGSHVGALKVEARYEFGSWIPYQPTWQKTMSVDYAYLISGEGRINIVGYTQYDVPMFEIGETAPVYVSADYSGATVGETGRWQLWAFPLRGGAGRMLKEWNYDYFRETYNWVLPADAWMRGASDSKWRLELHNTLFSQDAVMINTIDIKANAPPTPTILTAPSIPQLGDTITVTMSVSTNVNTHETVSCFYIRGTYIDNNYQFVYKPVTATGSDPFTATTTINPPRAGTFRLQVWAHDVAGRESETPAEQTIEVHEGKYRLTVTVKDQYDSSIIASARVEQSGGLAKITNPLGQVWFDLDQGSYSFQISKAGYAAVTKSYAISNIDRYETVFLTRTTNTWDLAVTVKTTDGNLVWGATVKVGGTEKLTLQTGVASFTDIAEGQYIVTARHGTMTGKKDVNLDRDQQVTITISEGDGDSDGEVTPWLVEGGIIFAIVLIVIVLYYLRRTGRWPFGGKLFKAKKKR